MFADGSVRFIKLVIDLNVFKALITRNGGEVIRSGAFLKRSALGS